MSKEEHARSTDAVRRPSLRGGALAGCGLAAVLCAASVAQAYPPPVGIPEPPFGIDESHAMYAGQTFAAGGFEYLDAGNGPYSHYVDDSSTQCTDDDNPYGTQARPRCSLPENLPAGSVVEVHGGPYRAQSWTASGTAEAPVFVRGTGPDGMVVIDASTDGMSLDGTYLIVEYMDFPGVARLTLSGNYIAVRYSYVHDRPEGIGQFVNMSGDYGVLYRNEIARNGGTDRHGVGVARGTTHNWILENHIHHNSGDAIQFCHGCIGSGNGPAYVFIGRNELHEDVENAIDIKETRGPVVISENVIYGYQPGPDSNGDAIRLNDEGSQGEIWVVANEIHDSRRGIEPAGSDGTSYIIGNFLYNIDGSAIGGSADYVINNTIYNAGTGIESGSEVRNNIVVDAGTAIASSVGVCSHNLAYQSSGRASIDRGCSDQLGSNPLFVNVGAFDFRLQEGSPARNSGMVPSQYQAYLAKYGVSLAADPNGEPRPQEGAWDRGAFEYGGGVTAVPRAPLNLTAQ